MGIDETGASVHYPPDSHHPEDVHINSTKSIGDSFLDPLDPVSSSSVQNRQEDYMSNSGDEPDPDSLASLVTESRSPSPEPPLDDQSYSGLDIDELCGLADENLRQYMDFIHPLHDASLDDEGMEKEVLEHIRAPYTHSLNLESDSDLRLSLDLYLANLNCSLLVYNANHDAFLWRHPEDQILTYDQAQRFVAQLTGVVPLSHDMCINSCTTYTGPLSDRETCPFCSAPHYDPVVLEQSAGKRKVAQQEFHTIPIGLQLQALYCSKESMEKMHYGEDKLDEIMRRVMAGMGGTAEYKDWCHGSDFLKAFSENHLKKGDPILMFSIDGVQLYCNKTSDCWMYIWVVFNFNPATRRWQSYSVLSSLAPTNPNFSSRSFSPACTIYLQYRGKVCLYGMVPQGHYTDPIHFWHL